MLTVVCRSLLKGVVALSFCALAVAAEAGEGSAAMGVSLTVTGKTFEGERFVRGKGAEPLCKPGEECAEAPLPTLTFHGARQAKAKAVSQKR